MVLMVPEVETETERNDEVEVEEKNVENKTVPVVDELESLLSRSSGTLNSVWGSFMQRAGAQNSSKSESKKTQGKKKRDRSSSPDRPKKTAKSDSVLGPTGLSKSAQAEKRYAEALDAGRFDPKKMAAFKEACLAADACAEFNAQRLRAVRCSNCSKETICAAQSGAPNHHRFTEHSRKCKGGTIRLPRTQLATAKTSMLTSGVFKGFQKLSAKVTHILKHPNSSPRGSPTIPKHFPCPGITEADKLKVPIYLRRSSALGGGSHLITSGKRA